MTDGSIIVYQSTGVDLIRNEDLGLTGNVGGCSSISKCLRTIFLLLLGVLFLCRIVMRCA